MTPTQQRIIDYFMTNKYATSKTLLDIAGFRYSARLHELRKLGYEFPWGFKKDLHGRKTKTTIYTIKKLDKSL